MNPEPQFQVNGPNVIHETIDNEVIIVNLDTGTYYSLEKSGARVWNMVAERTTVTTITRMLAEEFEADLAEIESAVRQILSELTTEDLIIEVSPRGSDEQTASAGPVGGQKMPFEWPILHRYTDMQDFILLDPIKEADEQGWPDLNQVRPA